MFSGQWPLLFQKGSWCISQIYQQLPSRVDIAQCPLQAGLRVTKFCYWCVVPTVFVKITIFDMCSVIWTATRLKVALDGGRQDA